LLRLSYQTAPRGIAPIEIVTETKVVRITRKCANGGIEGRRGDGRRGGGRKREAGDVACAIDVEVIKECGGRMDGVQVCGAVGLGEEATGGEERN
jgi:hypothetical protein